MTSLPAVTSTQATCYFLSFLCNKFKFLLQPMDQTFNNCSCFCKLSFFLFSDYRGYKARKDVSKLKTIAAKMETKRIYFLQQVRILINVFENASCSKQNSLFWWIFFSFYKEHFTVNVLCYWGMFRLYLKLIEYGYNRKLFWNEKSMTLLWVLIKWGASLTIFN